MVRRALLAVILALGVSGPSEAQDLIEMYRSARVEAQAEQLARQFGYAAKPHAPVRVPTTLDSMMAWHAPAQPVLTHTLPAPTHRFVGADWRPIRRLTQDWFNDRYGRTKWAFLGNHALSPLDTSMTYVLRARFQAQFGSPTRRLQDLLTEADADPQDYIQFEYWFVLNDSIPVLVMDTGGPHDRGVVLATDEQYRAALPDMRHALMTEIVASDSLAPYSDYYYDPELDTWYFTGYDARSRAFFINPISEPRHLMRRRQHATN